MNYKIVATALFVIGTLLLPVRTISAQEKPVLTIYTYDAFAADWGPGPKIKLQFEKQCNCILKFVVADSSIGALRKVQLEGANTKADIVLGLDTNIAQAARETGLFAEHGIIAENLTIPQSGQLPRSAVWADKFFLPFDYAHFAFVYNQEKIDNVPNSFEQLAQMNDDFKIVIQDPRSSTPGLGLILWVKAAYGERAAEIWRKISPKILTVSKGWSDAYGLFLKGEADMVMSYTTSPAYHLIAENDARFKSAIFSEGHYMQIEVAGALKYSKHPKLAREFLQFMLSETFQDIIPTTNWTYPIIKTAKGLPEKFDTLHIPAKNLLLDGQLVEKNRKQWIDEWLNAIDQ